MQYRRYYNTETITEEESIHQEPDDDENLSS